MKIKLDRSQWRQVKLGDVASEYSKRVNNPSESGFDRFVGNSNIGRWDFRIKAWERADSVTSAMKSFKSNDYLLVRRSLYASDFRERAPRANFAGVCSGDILTIRENPEEIADGFLVGVLNSPALWKFVVANASGSITRRIKWRDLANYEFLLPPKEQQAEIAELLWAMDEAMQLGEVVLRSSEMAKHALFKEYIYTFSKSRDSDFGKLSSKYPVFKLGQLITQMQYGISESLSEVVDGTPVLRMNNLQDGKLCLDSLKYYSFSDDDLEKYRLNKGDVLFNRTNSFDLVGKVSIFDADIECSFASYLLRIKTDEARLDPRYLNCYLNSFIGMSKIRKYRTPGVSQSNINATNLKRIPVPIPSIERQRELMARIALFENAELILSQKNNDARLFQQSLINQVF